MRSIYPAVRYAVRAFRKKPGFALVLFCAWSASACSGSPSAPTSLNQEITLAPGQSVPVERGSLTLRLLGVPSDTRCPANALCVHPGRARVDVQVTSIFDVRIARLDTAETKVVRLGRLTMELLELSPYPGSPEPIDPADYRARLRLTR